MPCYFLWATGKFPAPFHWLQQRHSDRSTFSLGMSTPKAKISKDHPKTTRIRYDFDKPGDFKFNLKYAPQTYYNREKTSEGERYLRREDWFNRHVVSVKSSYSATHNWQVIRSNSNSSNNFWFGIVFVLNFVLSTFLPFYQTLGQQESKQRSAFSPRW